SPRADHSEVEPPHRLTMGVLHPERFRFLVLDDAPGRLEAAAGHCSSRAKWSRARIIASGTREPPFDGGQRRPPNWKTGLRLFVTSAPPANRRASVVVVGGIHSHRNRASPANDRMAIDIAMT